MSIHAQQQHRHRDARSTAAAAAAVNIPSKVTAGQVQIARWRVARDQAAGRATPEPYLRIASVQLPEDLAS